MSSINKVQNRFILKNIVSPSLCFVEPNIDYSIICDMLAWVNLTLSNCNLTISIGRGGILLVIAQPTNISSVLLPKTTEERAAGQLFKTPNISRYIRHFMV